MHSYRVPLLFCLLLLPILVLLSAVTVRAHVSSDSMPDSVAEVEYSIFLEFKPDDLVVRNKLGMVYYRMNKLAEAEREFTRILKAEPDNYDALDGLGLVRAAQNNFEAAIRNYRKSIDVNPDDMMVYYHLGVSLEKKGSYTEAAEAYRTALAKWQEKYRSEKPNKKAAEFEQTVKTALKSVESKL